jgi:hypothetical protein
MLFLFSIDLKTPAISSTKRCTNYFIQATELVLFQMVNVYVDEGDPCPGHWQ